VTEIQYVPNSTVKLIKVSGSDDDVAMAAWVSFSGDDEERLQDRNRVKKLIAFLKREEHNSPFEHVVFTFRITAPIFVIREVFRHRSSAYNEQSGRYTEFEPVFYLPSEERPMIQEGKAGAYRFNKAEEWKAKLVRGVIVSVSNAAWAGYKYMIDELGVAKEVARMILPVNLMSTYYVTISARNLMHFLDLRTSEQALFEIREVADKMEEIFAKELPFTYDAYQSKKTLWSEFMEWKKSRSAT
jgi:thymidylate synthase (FAD)